jgi:hypothetical protein
MSVKHRYYIFFIFISLLVGCSHVGINRNNVKIDKVKTINKGINPEKNIPVANEPAPVPIKKAAMTEKEVTGHVIFISNSQACHCTLERCNQIREKLQEIIDGDTEYNGRVEIQEIDDATDPKKVDEYFKQYELGFIPSVILKDNKGEILYKTSYDFNEAVFKDILKNNLNSKSIK